MSFPATAQEKNIATNLEEKKETPKKPSVFQEFREVIGEVFEFFFSSDTDVLSNETKKILSNPEDRKKYFEAIDKLIKGKEKEVTITLSNGKSITLL